MPAVNDDFFRELEAMVRYAATIRFPSGGVVECWHTDSYELRGNVWQAVWSQATARAAT